MPSDHKRRQYLIEEGDVVMQKRTSPHKMYVVFLPSDPEYVYKGPYYEGSKKLDRLRAVRELVADADIPELVGFEEYEMNHEDIGGTWLRYPLICANPDTWETENYTEKRENKDIYGKKSKISYSVLTRSEHPTVRLAMERGDIDSVPSRILGVIMFLYAIGTGDINTRNIIFCNGKYYINDFEDRTGRAWDSGKIPEPFFFNSPHGDKGFLELSRKNLVSGLKEFEDIVVEIGEDRILQFDKEQNGKLSGFIERRDIARRMVKQYTGKSGSPPLAKAPKNPPASRKSVVRQETKSTAGKAKRQEKAKNSAPARLEKPRVVQALAVQEPFLGMDIGQMAYHGHNAGATTYHGFSNKVLISAIQKNIRRCNAEQSLACAFELSLFSNASVGTVRSVFTNLVNRLAIISAEDLSPLEAGLIMTVCDWVNFTVKKNSARNFKHEIFDLPPDSSSLYAITRCMAEAKKSRVSSHMAKAYGTEMGREVLADYAEVIEPNIGSPEDNLRRADRELRNKRFVAWSYIWAYYESTFESGGTKARDRLFSIIKKHVSPHLFDSTFACYKKASTVNARSHSRAFLQFIVAYICLGEGEEAHQDNIAKWYQRLKDYAADGNYRKYEGLDYQIEIEDYMLDIHTGKAKTNANRYIFATEGAFVNNEDPLATVKEFKMVYEDKRMYT